MTSHTYGRETLGLHKHLHSAAAGVSLVSLVVSELCTSRSPLVHVCVWLSRGCYRVTGYFPLSVQPWRVGVGADSSGRCIPAVHL